MTPVRKTIPEPDGTKIEDLRWSAHLTVTELASKADISRQYLNRIRNGHRGASIDVQKRIAQALNVPLFKIQRDAA
jgi:transcriptional regulator with XRE-family HTH domain